MENTEEGTVQEARAFMKKAKKAKKANRQKHKESAPSRSKKRKLTLAESYLLSIPTKIRKVVPQNKNNFSDSSQSESESKEGSEDEEEDENTQKRHKFTCPLRCGSRICQLPRHLRDVHGWDPERARNAVNHYEMRHDQRNSAKPKEVRHKRKQKYCIECGRKQRYLSKHLQKQHGYQKGTRRYWKALKESRPVHHFRTFRRPPFVEIDSSTASEESRSVAETLNLFEKNKSILPLPGARPTASSSSTVEKVTVEETESSDGEDDAEYFEEDEEESGDAEETNTEAYTLDQQSKRVFEMFEKWILSPDGGEKDPKPATLVVRQVEKILMMIGTETAESLFDKKLIRDKFYPESRVSHKAATTISYLHSLRKFYTFAMTEDDTGLTCESRSMADALFKKCGEWCKSLRKEVKERFWEKQEEDLSRLITPEKVQEFANTDFARNQVKTIGQLIEEGQSPRLGQIEYCDLRNFLFIHILAQNGPRSGVITNSTLDEYKKISCVDGTYMVAVKDHKTFSQHGQANLCFDESLKAWVDVYVEHARSQVETGDESKALFLNWKGGKMKSSDLSSALTSAWRKAGMIDNETRISGTLMRKSCTTAIRQYNKGVKGNVAAYMAHSERTADKHYHLVQKRTNSAFAAKQLTAVMHGRVSPATSSLARKDDDEQSNTRKDDCGPSNERSDDGELDVVPLPLVRQSWTEEEEKVIQEVFSDQISRQSVTLKDVLTLKGSHPLLVNCDNKRLLDKVRGIYRFKKSQNVHVGVDDHMTNSPRDDASLSDSNSIISPSTNRSKARVFEEEEVALFNELFKDMIQRGQKIEQPTVVQQLKQSGHEQMIEKYSKQKITDKIRGLHCTYIRQWRK